MGPMSKHKLGRVSWQESFHTPCIGANVWPKVMASITLLKHKFSYRKKTLILFGDGSLRMALSVIPSV